MSVQSRQALRIIKFVAEMKKNNYPNAKSFATLLKKIDIDENFVCTCSERTIMRDIETLQRDYRAPIAYDAARRGYYLVNPHWEFQTPIINDNILSMTLIGTRLASDILPNPLKTDMDFAMEKTFVNNRSDFLDAATMESLLCASGIKAAVKSEIFKKVFDGWRRNHVLSFSYQAPNQKPEDFKIEPHILAFHRGIWYMKGYVVTNREVRVFALQRILNIEIDSNIFTTDKKLLKDTKENGLFTFPKVENIRLRCDAKLAFYLYEHQKMEKLKLERQEDGSIIVNLPPVLEFDIIRWVLGEGGLVEVLSPDSLREKVYNAAVEILKHNEKKATEVKHEDAKIQGA